jgi:signal transduction histidine kinase
MFTRLRWLSIVLPVVFVLVVEGLSDTILDAALPFPLNTLLVGLAVLVMAIALSTVAFRRIDQLARELRDRNAEVEARAARARALHAMTVAMSGLTDVDEVLARTTADARSLLGADVACLTRATKAGDEMLAATTGPDAGFDPSGGQPGEDARRFVRPPFATSFLSAPMQRGDTTVGHLAIGSRLEISRQVDDLETLSSLANQAAIAIENDRLQRELRTLAIAAERGRIAREMHDGLAQVLGYVNTKSQAVEELLATDRAAEARDQMTELAAAARSIYVDVREAILGLSSPLGSADANGADAGAADVEAAISTYAHRFGEAAKLAVSVEADGLGGYAPLPPETIANVVRIVQEALTNVRKHAAAGRVVISLAGQADALEVTVADDGRGFDPTTPDGPTDWPHFGRQTIRERAEAIGGSASWESSPGEGTRFRLRVPAVRRSPAEVRAAPRANVRAGTETGADARPAG